MVYLAKQIANEIQNVFVAREDEFNTTVVKEEYKKVPKVTYPKVIVGETNNSEVQERRTTDGERTTAVTLQITTYSRDMQDYDNIQKQLRWVLNYYGLSFMYATHYKKVKVDMQNPKQIEITYA